jgi:hypothetical protein
LADVAQLGSRPADLFEEFAAGDFLGRQVRRKAASGNLVAPVINGLVYAISEVTFP